MNLVVVHQHAAHVQDHAFALRVVLTGRLREERPTGEHLHLGAQCSGDVQEHRDRVDRALASFNLGDPARREVQPHCQRLLGQAAPPAVERHALADRHVAIRRHDQPPPPLLARRSRRRTWPMILSPTCGAVRHL
jgi:hypothetical protein